MALDFASSLVIVLFSGFPLSGRVEKDNVYLYG